MATFYKRKGARGIRWTARVRFAGREITKTFGTKAMAESWARSQELAIEAGEFKRPAVRHDLRRPDRRLPRAPEDNPPAAR